MEYSFTYYRLKFYIGWQCMTRGGKGYATANLRLCEQNVSSHETINFTWMFHNGKVKDRQGSVGVVTNEYSLPRICLNGRGFPWQVKNKGAKGTRAVTKIQVTWKRKAVIFLWIWLFRNSGLETMSTLLLATYIACPYEINQIEASSFLQST